VPTIIAVTNQKGGSAKTNVAGNLGAEFAALGRSVVLVDCDPQATLTRWALGTYEGVGTAEALLGDGDLSELLIDVPEFGAQGVTPKLLPSSPRAMRAAERSLMAEFGAERGLAEMLGNIEADFVLLDCPPSMGVLTASAIVAAQAGVLVPIASSAEALDGLIQLQETLRRLRSGLRLPLPLLGIVLTRYDERTLIAREVAEAVRSLAEGAVFDATIREAVVLRELFGHQKPIRSYAPSSRSADDYRQLAQEILAHVVLEAV
jgi:chromosome partitioning protein